MDLWKAPTRAWLRFVFSVAVVVLAAALRIWPLQGLELRIPWVTFYPAVMVTALYGGFPAGLVSAVLSALTVYVWSPTGQPFIRDPGDWLGMAVFLVNCIMISLVAEAMLRAQARARRAQAQAEAANRAKSVFLATMSHELRTPLNAILGFSNLMRADPASTSDQRENLEIINRSGEHLLSLINDVLDMAKIESGRVILEPGPFDVGAMVRDVIDLLSPRALEKGLQLVLDQSSAFPRFVVADQEKVRHILVNLVGNAIKYTDQGGVVLRLGTRKADTLRLIIEVQDTGVGISPEDQARIFEPFVQVGRPATQKGTGLGLAIVREYLDLMGGSIAVESAPGKGSLFRAVVPVQTADASQVPAPLPEQARVIGLAPGQPEYRILIVEDQRENWMLLQRLLNEAGFRQVEVAEDGAKAVTAFQRFRPHFIWMDRRMPIMDGIEATRRIRALPGGGDVKIAAVTASAFSDQRVEMLAAGMDDFVRKPYRPEEIFDSLARLLGVRFQRAGAPAPRQPEPEISRDALAALPATLRHDLIQGLVRGNLEELEQLVGRVRASDARVAEAMARQISAFNYLPMLRLLEAIETETNQRQ